MQPVTKVLKSNKEKDRCITGSPLDDLVFILIRVSVPLTKGDKSVFAYFDELDG